jgi:hypothetical protein
MNETQNNRRDFFKEAGKKALWAAPTITLLMTASSQPALATKNGYGHDRPKPKYKPKKKKKFYKSSR